MCRHGDQVKVVINGREWMIDRCLVPMVKALNKAGIKTASCCCGHGEHDGYILTYYEEEYRLIILPPSGKESLNRFEAEFRQMSEQNQIITESGGNKK